MKEIPLTQNKFAIIDDDDWDVVIQYKWYALKQRKKYYAVAHTKKVDGKDTLIGMHRLIMNAPSGVEVDHADRDPLNNQRSNLRFATASQQGTNKDKIPGCSSKYKGVSWKRDCGLWIAQIRVKKLIYLGTFKSEIDAAKAYDQAAIKNFGEFAKLNFPSYLDSDRQVPTSRESGVKRGPDRRVS